MYIGTHLLGKWGPVARVKHQSFHVDSEHCLFTFFARSSFFLLFPNEPLPYFVSYWLPPLRKIQNFASFIARPLIAGNDKQLTLLSIFFSIYLKLVDFSPMRTKRGSLLYSVEGVLNRLVIVEHGYLRNRHFLKDLE